MTKTSNIESEMAKAIAAELEVNPVPKFDAGGKTERSPDPAPVENTDTIIRNYDVRYTSLASVLREAYDQAASGKGQQRHNPRSTFFDQQPILEIGRMVGLGFHAGQAMKKAQEAATRFQRNPQSREERERAVAELLGAINYLAAGIILIRELD